MYILRKCEIELFRKRFVFLKSILGGKVFSLKSIIIFLFFPKELKKKIPYIKTKVLVKKRFLLVTMK